MELRKYQWELFFKIILHTINSPETSSKYNIFAHFIQTVNWNWIKQTEKTVCNIGLFIIIIAKEYFKIYFCLIKLEFSLFNRNYQILVLGRNRTIVVFNISKFLISDFQQNFFTDLWIHECKFISDNLLNFGCSSINKDITSEQWISLSLIYEIPSNIGIIYVLLAPLDITMPVYFAVR